MHGVSWGVAERRRPLAPMHAGEGAANGSPCRATIVGVSGVPGEASLVTAPVCHPLERTGGRRTGTAKTSDQGGALTGRLAGDVVDLAGDEASGHARDQSRAVEVPPDRVFHDGDAPPGCSRSITVMLVSVALRPILLNCTPSHSAVTPLIVRLRPIVLPLIDQGISPPPPVSVTFPPTVTFLDQDGVRVGGGDVPVDGDGGVPGRIDGCTALPRTCRSCLPAGSPGRGASPRRQ